MTMPLIQGTAETGAVSKRPVPLIIMLLALTGLCCSTAQAQPAEQGGSQAPVTETGQGQDTTHSEAQPSQSAATTENEEERPDIDSQPIESDTTNQPGRFVPSEQISLDLGVSFPVDV